MVATGAMAHTRPVIDAWAAMRVRVGAVLSSMEAYHDEPPSNFRELFALRPDSQVAAL